MSIDDSENNYILIEKQAAADLILKGFAEPDSIYNNYWTCKY